MGLFATVVVASLASYALKLAGVSLPESVLGHEKVQRISELLPIAMLTALVATDLFDSDRHYHLDWQLLVGVAAGAIALRFRQPLIVVFLVAVVTTAVLRLLT
jgi:branched-subunit amino acid transport protein